MEETKEIEVEPKLSREDYISIMKGVRPEGMDYEHFKFLRNMSNKVTQNHLKGSFVHVSQGFPYKDEETGKTEVMYSHKGRTYVKTE